jgi:HK97 family phage prohead protease
MMRFTATSVSIDAAASDGTPTRTITGIAVPYGVPATVSDGTEVIFERGSLPVDGKAPRLYLNHSAESAIGIVTARYDDEEGMMFTAKISKTMAGDEALQLALDGVLDSVSVGVNPTKTRANEDGSVTVLAADWIELSMVPVPAFAGAVITDIAASIHHEPEETDNNEIQEPTEETEPMSEVTVPAVEATIPTAAIPAQPKRQFNLPTPGEYHGSNAHRWHNV